MMQEISAPSHPPSQPACPGLGSCSAGRSRGRRQLFQTGCCSRRSRGGTAAGVAVAQEMHPPIGALDPDEIGLVYPEPLARVREFLSLPATPRRGATPALSGFDA